MKEPKSAGFPGPSFWEGLLESGPGEAERLLSSAPWDRMASRYDDLESSPFYRRELEEVLETLKARGVLGPEIRVLDVASGTGPYAVRMAPHVREVLCLDISKAMLERLEEKVRRSGIRNVQTLLADWREWDPGEEAWDLVFASMTPLFRSPESVRKMLRASRRHLVLRGWAGVRENPILSEIREEILGKRPGRARADITLVFSYLYSLGYAPEIRYFHGELVRELPVSEALERVLWHLELEGELSRAQRERAEALLRSRAEDGRVRYATRVRTGLLLLEKSSYRAIMDLSMSAAFSA